MTRKAYADTPCASRQRGRGERASAFHAQAGLLAVSGEIHGPPTARLPSAGAGACSEDRKQPVTVKNKQAGCGTTAAVSVRRVTAATMMTMSAGSTRSGCFRFADACPAWMQIDTDRYLPGGYLGTEYGVQYLSTWYMADDWVPGQVSCRCSRQDCPPTQARSSSSSSRSRSRSRSKQASRQANPACWLVPSFLPGPALLPCPWAPTLALAQPVGLLNPRCDREGVSLPSGDLS